MANYTKMQDRRARQSNRQEGVERFEIFKGKQKGVWYIVNVPDYDKDCPKRIISIAKYRDAKHAQSYYEAWVNTHRPAYEQRMAEKAQTDQKERKSATPDKISEETRKKILLERNNESLKRENDRLKSEARKREAELMRKLEQAKKAERKAQQETASAKDQKPEQKNNPQKTSSSAKEDTRTSSNRTFFDLSAKAHSEAAAGIERQQDRNAGRNEQNPTRQEVEREMKRRMDLKAEEKRKAEDGRRIDEEYQAMHRAMAENDRRKTEKTDKGCDSGGKVHNYQFICAALILLVIFIIMVITGIRHLNEPPVNVTAPEVTVSPGEPAITPNDTTAAITVTAAEDSTATATTMQDAGKIIENANKELLQTTDKITNLACTIMILISVIIITSGSLKYLKGHYEEKDLIEMGAGILLFSIIALIIKNIFLKI